VLVGAINRDTGAREPRVLDVIEASIARRLPLKIIHQIIEYQRAYQCVAWAFEAVQFQEFMRQQLIDMSIEEGCPVPARALTPKAEKELRIESLQPFVERGLIRLHPSQQSLIDEMRHYPNGEHVDGLDALHMLWVLAVAGGVAAGATVADGVQHAARRNAARMFGRAAWPLRGAGWER
jgi:predicted phage terminase large subunit-like protein